MRILIAEDSLTQAVDLRRRLEALGHEVIVANDGLQAWNLLQKNPERLVILDWMMPEMNGLDLCRKIRADQKSNYTYIIVLTAKTHRHERLQGLSAGADDFLTKPIDGCELDIALRTAQRIIAAQEALVARTRQLEAANLDLMRRTEHDELTGLRNQRGLLPVLEEALCHASNDRLPVSLIRFDLDHSGRLTETLDPPALDELHRKVANLLRAECRECDVPARTGDHGFAVILPGLTAEWAVQMAENLKAVFAELPGADGGLTASFGLATVNPGGTSRQLLRACESAVQQARSGGGDRMVCLDAIAESTALA